MYGFLNLRSSVVRNLWAHKFQTIQANVAAPRAFVANQGFAHGRSAFASNARTPARGEWANYRETARVLLAGDVNHARYKYDADALTKLPKSYNGHLGQIVRSKAFGLSPLFTHYVNPLSMVQFAAKYVLSYRFLFIYMARTTFQAVRPLLAFCVFGEIMKLILANISGGVPAFLFSFVLAFEVLYFFLQCYISYTFLTMFFTVMF